MISAITNKGTCYTSSFNSSRQEDWTLLTLFKPETKVNKIVSHKKYGLKCKFSPDSKFIVTTSADHTAKLWNTEDNAFIKVSNCIYILIRGVLGYTDQDGVLKNNLKNIL